MGLSMALIRAVKRRVSKKDAGLPGNGFSLADKPVITPAMARSLVPAVDMVCRLMLRLRSNTRSMGR